MIEVKNISKVYREGKTAIPVLKNLSLVIPERRRIGIVGGSGTGKSTLLHILGGLDEPTTGEVWVEGKNLYQLPEQQRAHLRNHFFGFVFQFYHLFAELNALENTLLPALIAGHSFVESQPMAAQVLEAVGLAKRADHSPGELSGGEQQRVAMARACLLKPKLILADEPTGNLDPETGQKVLQYLMTVANNGGGSLVMVTHDRTLLDSFDVVYELKDGTLHPQ